MPTATSRPLWPTPALWSLTERARPVGAAAHADPSLFVRHDGLLVIDEVQRVPDLFLAIKHEVNTDPRLGAAQGGRVVDPVAGHAGHMAGLLRPLDQAELALGQHHGQHVEVQARLWFHRARPGDPAPRLLPSSLFLRFVGAAPVVLAWVADNGGRGLGRVCLQGPGARVVSAGREGR